MEVGGGWDFCGEGRVGEAVCGVVSMETGESSLEGETQALKSSSVT